MAGCEHHSRRRSHTQQFCGRYGEYIPELGVKMRVVQHPTGAWVFTCSACAEATPLFFDLEEDALRFGLRHHTADHPRDLVTFYR